MKFIGRNSNSMIVSICNRLSDLKNELHDYQYKLQRSSIFLKELEKWLEKLRHKYYLKNMQNEEFEEALEIKRSMNEITSTAN